MPKPFWQIFLDPKQCEGGHRASGATTTRQCEVKKRPQARVSRSQEFQGSDCHWFLTSAFFEGQRIFRGDAVDRARADHRTQEAQWLLPELADADFVGFPAIFVWHIVFSLHRLLGGGIHFDRSFRDVSGERFARCGARNWGCVRTSRTPKKSNGSEKISDVGISYFRSDSHPREEPSEFPRPRRELPPPAPDLLQRVHHGPERVPNRPRLPRSFLPLDVHADAPGAPARVANHIPETRRHKPREPNRRVRVRRVRRPNHARRERRHAARDVERERRLGARRQAASPFARAAPSRIAARTSTIADASPARAPASPRRPAGRCASTAPSPRAAKRGARSNAGDDAALGGLHAREDDGLVRDGARGRRTRARIRRAGDEIGEVEAERSRPGARGDRGGGRLRARVATPGRHRRRAAERNAVVEGPPAARSAPVSRNAPTPGVATLASSRAAGVSPRGFSRAILPGARHRGRERLHAQEGPIEMLRDGGGPAPSSIPPPLAPRGRSVLARDRLFILVRRSLGPRRRQRTSSPPRARRSGASRGRARGSRDSPRRPSPG